MRGCRGRRRRGLGGHPRGRNGRGRRRLGGRTAAGWRGRAVLGGPLDEAGWLGAGREGRGAVGCIGWRLPGDAVPAGWGSRPLGEACPRRGDPGTGPTALFIRSTRLGTGLSFTGSCPRSGPSTTGPRPRARLPPTGPYLRPGPSTTGPSLSARPTTTEPRPQARPTHTRPRLRARLTHTRPRLQAGPSLIRSCLEAQPSTPRPVPHRPRRRGEAIVQGVRGRCGARVVGGVVQLPPPVVLVTATGGCSPLLAHAPNCPPHRPYENGASRKSSPPRASNCVAKGSPDGSTPHGRTARRRRVTPTIHYGGRTSW